MNTTTLPAQPKAASTDFFDADMIATEMDYVFPWKVRALIKRNMPTLRTLGPVITRRVHVTAEDGSVWEVDDYEINRTQAAVIGALVPTPKGNLSGAYMAELEALFYAGHLVVADTPEAKEAVQGAAERHRERQRAAMGGVR
ncbi:Uncharacterised protein [Starkeya nomas]|uniref:Uncharacterized protein n=1 Tax=Starkeya nomas TaxID=2666134 RepID=A0A5S9PZ53_9HYPH|nr:hypothetical protein [Starkeya nomas]CAA0110481.1 Uncharacterised protein [Starkeya nomas]